MNKEFYKKFLYYLDQGLRKKASESLAKFVSSCANDEEKQNWVWLYLKELKKDHYEKVRYEIFRELIFPVLKKDILEMIFYRFFG